MLWSGVVEAIDLFGCCGVVEAVDFSAAVGVTENIYCQQLYGSTVVKIVIV